MKLQNVIESAGYRVSGGSEYLWRCFGDARLMDFVDLDGNEDVVGCIYSPEDQRVFEVSVWVPDDKVVYRWIDPEFVDEQQTEAEKRHVNNAVAYDDVSYTDISDENEILKLANKVIHCTYVHSATTLPSWPFAKIENTEGNEGQDEDQDDDEDDGEVDEFIERCREEMANAAAAKSPKTLWDVTLTTKHRLEIRAENMEEAINKAHEFKDKIKISDWGDGVIWMDHYISKEKVGRRLD